MSSPSDSLTTACELLVDVFERVVHTERHRAIDEIAAIELSVSQLRMLFVLAECPEPVSVNELADAIGLSLAAAGRGVDRMVSMGLVDRREDRDDRRVKRLSLTAEGHTLLDESFRIHPEKLRPGVAAMPDDVRTQLIGALRGALPYLSTPFQNRGACAHTQKDHS